MLTNPPCECGPRHTFQKVEFWAENGMINVIDHSLADDPTVPYDRSHRRMAPGRFLKQAIAAFMSVPDKWSSDVREANRMLEAAQAAVKLARAQGDPTDVSVHDYEVRHRRRSSLLFASSGGEAPVVGNVRYKILPGHPARLLSGEEAVQVVPDLEMPYRKAMSGASPLEAARPVGAGLVVPVTTR